MQLWILECAVCGEPFEREFATAPMGEAAGLHARPGFPGEPCAGSNQVSFVAVRKDEYRRTA